jgi:hypothetical protein
MRKTALLFGVLAIAAVMFISASVGVRPVKAQGDYNIGYVFHTVKVLYNGYVFINDTLKLNVTGGLSDFLIGFPDKYGPSVIKCVAFNDTDTFAVTLNTPLNGRVGFYWVKIDFNSTSAPQVFTVGFVLSNSLVTQDSENTSQYSLDFPAYPSLTKEADFCNASIVVPNGASLTNGTVSGFSYGQENLQAFTYAPASLGFNLTDQTLLSIVDITKLERDITVSELGEMGGVDTYDIVNKAPANLTSFQVVLPPNASNPSAKDQYGRNLQLTQQNTLTNRYQVSLTLNVSSGQFSRFTLAYSLPSNYIAKSSNDFTFSLSMFEYEDYFINETLTTITFPEGAKVSAVSGGGAGSVNSISKSMYQETVVLDQKSVIILSMVSIEATYEYNPFWASFRPSLWAWAVTLVGCMAFVVVRQRPKGPSRVPISTGVSRLSPELFKFFVDTYDEKKRIESELESLETRVEKGRIPRRRYKVMRKTSEARLDTVLRRLAGFKERMRAAGGRYSGLMLQLEVAEAEIGEVKNNVKNAESLHNRGELSLEAYHNRLADYQRRKEKAGTTINGILLRIREEIR